jgi:hypothetical protein
MSDILGVSGCPSQTGGEPERSISSAQRPQALSHEASSLGFPCLKLFLVANSVNRIREVIGDEHRTIWHNQ